jgi:hypothetical protein
MSNACSWLGQSITRQEVGFNYQQGPREFSSERFLLFAFSSPASTQPLTDISTKGFLLCKVQLVHTADSSAILVVPNVKVGMEAQHSIPGLSLHYLLEGSFTFTVYYSTNCHCFLPKSQIHVFLCQLA